MGSIAQNGSIALGSPVVVVPPAPLIYRSYVAGWESCSLL